MEVCNWEGKRIGFFTEREGEKTRLFFEAEVPPFGYSTYRIKQKRLGKRTVSGGQCVVNERDYIVENELYKIIFDLSKGGIIKSLIAKKEGNKDFASQKG